LQLNFDCLVKSQNYKKGYWVVYLEEKSVELIKKRSLLCKLLSLKADDRDADPEELVIAIYRAAEEMKDVLTDDQLLLIRRWVRKYTKISVHSVDVIRKEVKMDIVETTITEHISNQAEAKGKAEGKVEGQVEGQIEILEKLFQEGILTAKQLKAKIEPLRHKMLQLAA